MVVSVSSVGSASGAAAYYAADNYYTADKAAELSEWGGEGAARLGLSGPVDAALFEAVLSGRLPNGAAISGGGGEHRAGLDLTFITHTTLLPRIHHLHTVYTKQCHHTSPSQRVTASSSNASCGNSSATLEG